MTPEIARFFIRGFYRFYRTFVSPFLGGNCRFYPTCSDYARQAVEQHGFLKGGVLTFCRLVRCHPWHRCDYYDPVPDTFCWKAYWFKRF